VGASWVSDNWEGIRAQEASHTLGPGGIAQMASKDLHLAVELSRETGTPMPLAEYVVENILPDLEVHGMTGER
jgi:3-hydroxyisobutyrate dehydrogenase-like beta-hydroxyacid dehydrogenase